MTKLLISTAFAAIAVSAAAAPTGAPAVPPRPIAGIPTQLPRTARPLAYRIEIAPDAKALRFSGKAQIGVQVLAATRSLTLNAADLQIASATLQGPAPQNATVATDAAAQTATFTFARPIARGNYRLDIDYSGKINQQASGLFALDYQGASGPKRALYTQFEAPDARRMFPSWDEPQFRTPYDLGVVVPAGQTAIGNMPERGRQKRPDGTMLVTFATTPPMPSYLLFMAVGEFDRITKMASSGTEVGVVTKAGDGEKGRLALDAEAEILPYYNDYFGQRFPLPKLDNVAGPGSSQFFGAMENWGAIFSFESILLVDPAITTEATRQRIYGVEAHEMAHQWFGDLVTMAWWNDLWLNEGFASWMSTKATDHFHPEWQVLLSRLDGREQAIGLDAVRTTHAIVQNIATVDEISQAFDAITYQKGEAVITMLENYVGADAWRAGVRDYMATYKFGNTVTDDLWTKVERAAGKPITAIAHDFTLQPGVPLIRVAAGACRGGSTPVTLTQGEFSRDNPGKSALTWRVPVVAGTAGGVDTRTLVSGGQASVSVPGCGALIVNKGQSGYYRTLYTPALLDRIKGSYASLAPADQIGLLGDNWGLGLAGYQSASLALDLLDRMPAQANSQLVDRAASILRSAHDLYEGDPAGQARVARYASAKLSPMLARLGMDARAGEASNDAVLRSELITTLGDLGDPAVTADARRRFAALRADPNALNGPLRTTILGIVASNADAATWDQLHAQALAEKVPLVRGQLYRLLASTRDETLARRALALALTDEPGATTSSAMIGVVAYEHPDLAFDFALANRVKVAGLVDASSSSRFFPGLASGSSNPAMVAKLQDYATRYMTPQSRRPADIAIGRINDRLRVRKTAGPVIAQWFEAHKG